MEVSRLRFRKRVTGSSLGKCPRKAGYWALNDDHVTEDRGPVENYRFTDGHWHEWDVKRRLVEKGVVFSHGISKEAIIRITLGGDGFQIYGHPDGGVRVPDGRLEHIPGGDYLLEVKSAAPGPYWRYVKSGYREAWPEYFDQIQGYLNGSQVDLVPLADRNRDNPVIGLYPALAPAETLSLSSPQRALIVVKNKETGGWKTEIVDRDEGYFAGLSRRWREADGMVADGNLPDRLHETPENWECRDCPFRQDCWGTWLAPVPKKELAVGRSLEEVESAAKIFAAGKKLSEIGTAMMDQTASLLEVEGLGKAEIGKVKINQYAQTRTVWDHKGLEKMLSSSNLAKVKSTKEIMVTRRTVEGVTREDVREAFGILGNSEGGQMLLGDGVVEGEWRVVEE